MKNIACISVVFVFLKNNYTKSIFFSCILSIFHENPTFTHSKWNRYDWISNQHIVYLARSSFYSVLPAIVDYVIEPTET